MLGFLDLGREGVPMLGFLDLGREGVPMLGFLLGVTLLAQMQLYGGTLPCGGDQSNNPVTRSSML